MNSKRALVLASLLAAGGCSWFTDFRNEPKIKPWEAQMAGNDTTPFRGQPEMSVPITGVTEPAYVVSHSPFPPTIDSMASIPNPHLPSKERLDNGRKYYQINCAVCHGASGQGNGPATKYGIPAPNLVMDMTKNRTDGYIWGMMRNGRGIMPNYDRIESSDRWDVVLYVRALQGKLPGVVADTSPAGFPGQNGRTVPGFTRTAPTRPAPYRPQDMDRTEKPDTAASAAPAAPAPPPRKTP